MERSPTTRPAPTAPAWPAQSRSASPVEVNAAWKMRAVVYGLLAVIAVLVLVGRSSADDSGEGPPRVDTLSGHTVQGSLLHVFLDGTRVARVTSHGVWARCGGKTVGVSWSPMTDQPNVTYTHRGSYFLVHERPDPRYPRAPHTRSNIYINGTISKDRRHINGVINYYETGPYGKCQSGSIAYWASR